MAGYTKLFNSILDSTIWQESSETRLLWITMLAMSDKSGEVLASIPGLAKRAGITIQECETGLSVLLSPDPYSRTPEHEGRRIAIIDGGWRLLNHGKYRALLSADERREYNRMKQAEHRAKTKSNNVNDTSITVIENKQCQHITDNRYQITDPLLNIEEPKGSSHPAKAGKEWNPDEKQIRVASWFNRRASTKWSDKELRAWSKLDRSNETLDLLQGYYGADIIAQDDWRRKDLLTLLNNWTGEMDRARRFVSANTPKQRDPARPF